jgi:hypothetical protein
LRGPLWDGVWLHGALWLAPLALWLVHGHASPGASPLDLLYFALTALFWIGHRVSSVWLAYCTEAYRPLLRARPVRFVALPLAASAACFAWFLPPDDALPWTRAERLVALAILDYALVTHHFAAQHFGALSLYRTRIGRTPSVTARGLDRLFAFGVGGALVLLADLLAGAAAYQELWLEGGAVAGWLASAHRGLRGAALLGLLAATGAMLTAEARAARPSLPRVLYVLGIAAMVAIALQPRSAFLFLVIWNAQHWLLATGLASRTPSAEPAPARGAVRRGLHAVNARPWALVLLLASTSLLLLPLFEVEANRDGGIYYGDRIFGAAAAALRESTWVPTLVALGFATGFAHYALDRALYRLSDPAGRAAARGLLEPP